MVNSAHACLQLLTCKSHKKGKSYYANHVRHTRPIKTLMRLELVTFDYKRPHSASFLLVVHDLLMIVVIVYQRITMIIYQIDIHRIFY